MKKRILNFRCSRTYDSKIVKVLATYRTHENGMTLESMFTLVPDSKIARFVSNIFGGLEHTTGFISFPFMRNRLYCAYDLGFLQQNFNYVRREAARRVQRDIRALGSNSVYWIRRFIDLVAYGPPSGWDQEVWDLTISGTADYTNERVKAIL